MADASREGRAVVLTVFLALVMDLLAFTMPLPLFPRLIAWYLQRESRASQTLLSRLLELSYRFRNTLQSVSGQSVTGRIVDGGKNWDIVLLGGAMGSLFSFCQCLISPWLGSHSDRYGRKKVLLATMIGNILSAIIWLQSTTFASFLLSRLVGGLSEGNVQLSTAIISDVITTETRSKSLALVGIAFSICFTLGPSIGAYFASRPHPLGGAAEDRWNVYALPAAISLVLLLAETLYLAIRLPETRHWRKTGDAVEQRTAEKGSKEVKESVDSRLARLRAAGRLHGLFLLFFSGFTLTFLTYDLFAASNAQNGRLLSYIGVLSALLQARHVRPSLARLGELRVASYGIVTCILALSLLASLPIPSILSSSTFSTVVLYSAATCLSYTSATVVTALTASAASCCEEDDGPEVLRRGRALGGFRSRGQLGRAIGPLLASSVYWMMGPSVCYAGVGACLVGLYLSMGPAVREEKARTIAKKAN